MEFQGTK